jgi:hypothetical protein
LKVSEEALWLLCVKVDLSTYICKSRVSAELLAEAIASVFSDSIKRIELRPVKADDDVEIAERLEEVRRRLVEEIEGKALQCRNWTRLLGTYWDVRHVGSPYEL